MRKGQKSIFGKLLRSERGATAMLIGLALIAIIGMAALGSEIVYVLLKHREMQSAADSAAVAGATALGMGYPADLRVEANAVATASGFAPGVDGTTVTINNPPTSGPYAGNAGAVEVIVAQPQNLSLISLFRSGVVSVGARSVALMGSPGAYCILSTDPTASGGVYLKNNAVVANPKCGVAVNSGSSTALIVENNAAINGPVHVHGDWSIANNAALAGSPNVNNAPVVEDPYADVAIQTPPACTAQSGNISSGTVSLMPGHFCNGWILGNTATVNLAPGTYYIDQNLTLKNNVTVNGTGGVTLIVNGNYAVEIGNASLLNITAPTSGNYAGLALMSGHTASASIVQDFANNAILSVTGAIYFPNQTVRIGNNSTTAVTQCTQLIARIIDIRNNVNFDNECDLSGVKPIGAGTPAQLVE